jgi:Tol biopolymer transport system component
MIAAEFSRRIWIGTALSLAVSALCATTVAASVASASDAGRIAFVGNQAGSFQLYTMDPNGTNVIQITNLASSPFETWVPDFSPDGKRITFCYGNVNGSGNLITEIYVMNVDGTGLAQITNDGLFDCFPRWSPDGRLIVFGRMSPITFQLVVASMRPDGSGKRELTTPYWGIARSGFTPDGERIVWETQQAGFTSVVWSMDWDGSHQKRLTPARLKAGEVSAPSSDGKHIVFIDNQNIPPVLPNEIYGMNLDGTGIQRLTKPVGDSHDVLPNYSPDGTKIVFASDRMSSDGSLDLFTMNADGSNMTRIATGITVGGCADKNCVSPAWGRKPSKPAQRPTLKPHRQRP